MPKTPKKSKEKELTLDDWLERLLLIAVGAIVIGFGVIGLSLVFVGVGSAIFLAPILGTPRLRNNLKLIINWKGRKQTVKDSPGAVAVQGDKNVIQVHPPQKEQSPVTQKEISDSAVIGGDVHGDVIINPGAKPLLVEKKDSESSNQGTIESGTTVLVDEAVVIQPRDTKEYKIVLKKGQLATIEAGADYPITVELISQTQILKSEKRGLKTIEVERSRTGVKNANIEYEAKRNGTWFVHIHNDQRKLPLEVGVIISVE